MRRQDLASNIEVRGRVVLAVVDVMGAFRSVAMRVLARGGIVDPRPDEWYPLRGWLDAFDTIAREVGPNTVYQIGRQVAASGEVPPGVADLHQALAMLDGAYHAEHRGGEVGHYNYLPTGPRAGTMVCTTPYPSDFDRGVLQALAERLDPGGVIDVQLAATAETRKQGGASCTFHIRW